MTLESISRIAVANRALPPAIPEATSTTEVAQAPPDSLPRYLSPVYRIDQQAKIAILAFRDSSTGAVTQQYPPERVVQEYRRNGGIESKGPEARQSGGQHSAAGQAPAAKEAVAQAVQAAGGAGQAPAVAQPAKSAPASASLKV